MGAQIQRFSGYVKRERPNHEPISYVLQMFRLLQYLIHRRIN